MLFLPLNLGLNAAWRLAQNRTRWRGTSWKLLRSSQGHAPDDDDDDGDECYLVIPPESIESSGYIFAADSVRNAYIKVK